MLISCPECKKEYSDQAKACVHCGARNPKRMGPGLKLATILAAVLCVFLALVLIGNLAYDPEKERDQRAIAECKKTENDPLLDADARRLARGACELLEQRYREKYGHAP